MKFYDLLLLILSFSVLAQFIQALAHLRMSDRNAELQRLCALLSRQREEFTHIHPEDMVMIKELSKDLRRLKKEKQSFPLKPVEKRKV